MGYESTILGIVSTNEGGFRRKELIDECVREGIDKRAAKATITRMLEDGSIVEDENLRIRSE